MAASGTVVNRVTDVLSDQPSLRRKVKISTTSKSLWLGTEKVRNQKNTKPHKFAHHLVW